MLLDLTYDWSQSQERGNDFICNVTTRSDLTKNYATGCWSISKKRIKIKLDFYNLINLDVVQLGEEFIFTIKNLFAPHYLPDSMANRIKIQVAFCSEDDNVINYQSLQYEADTIQFGYDTELIDVYWNFYQINKNSLGEVTHAPSTTEVYIGYYSKLCQLEPNEGKYFTTFKYEFLSQNISYFAFKPSNNFQAKVDSYASTFSMAGTAGAQSGIYTILAQKTQGDEENIYQGLPPLKIILSGQLCRVSSQQTQYKVPIGGQSLPIIIDFFNCFPAQQIKVSYSFSPPQSHLQINDAFTVNEINSSSIDSQVIFVFKYVGTAPKDTNFTLNFQLDGTNKDSFYFSPASTLLTIDDAAAYIKPVAYAISNIQQQGNSVSVKLQCSQNGMAYWAYGLYPSVQDFTLANITSKLWAPPASNRGILANYTDPDDPYLVVYGYDSLTFTQYANRLFSYLKSDSKYQAKYFCVNQMNLVSDSITATWLSPSNGGFLLKITLLYSQSMNYQLNNKVTCKLASMFGLDKKRVLNEISNYCDQQPYSNSIGAADQFLKSSVGNLIPYYFYVIPDYFSEFDSTNTDIRSLINEDDFLTKLVNEPPVSSLFPSIVSLTTEDIIENSVPQFFVHSLSSEINTLTVTASITNMFGYIVIGLKAGYYAPSVTIDQLKQNLYGNATDQLDHQVHRYAQQNVVQTFIFRGLVPGTRYTIFLAASVDDPSVKSQGTSVIIKYISTVADTLKLKLAADRLAAHVLLSVVLAILLVLLQL